MFRFQKILNEQNEDNLDSVKNEEESMIERIFHNKTERYSTSRFEDVRQERSIMIFLGLTDPDTI